jgi:hypothetical protein
MVNATNWGAIAGLSPRPDFRYPEPNSDPEPVSEEDAHVAAGGMLHVLLTSKRTFADLSNARHLLTCIRLQHLRFVSERTPLRTPRCAAMTTPDGLKCNTIRRIAVFCGASSGNSPEYMEGARQLGQEMVRRGIGLVYGGKASMAMSLQPSQLPAQEHACILRQL